MKKILLIGAGMALSLVSLFGQVTFPDPSTIATKSDVQRAVSEMEQKLRAEFGTGTPVQKDCEHGLKLVSVSKQTTVGAEYNFYSVGVKNLLAIIYDLSGKEVFRQLTENITRDRIGISYSLAPGTYQMIISNVDCRAVSLPVTFTIASGSGPVLPAEPTGFVNPGVYSEKVGGLLYEWIPSENLSVQIQNGKVKLIAPETVRSWNGNNTCRRFLLGDLYDGPLPESEEKALFGEGLALPPGAYGFRIVYADTENLDSLKKKIWYVIGDGGGGGNDHSAQMETLQLSITSPDMAGPEGVRIPSDLLRASWLPHYQLLPYNLKLPADKGFGTTRVVVGIPVDTLFKKFTHLQARYDWLVGVPIGKLWNNLQAYNHQGQLVQPDWVINNNPVDPNFITVAELAENYGNIEQDCPRCYDKAEEVFRGLYGRYQRERGVKSPAETRLYDDYFGALYGYSLEMNMGAAKVDLRKGLASISNARKRYDSGSFYDCGYFAGGAYNYRNYRIGGYIGNLFNTLSGGGIYRNIYNLEKVNLAIPDRKILKNGWQTGEGLNLDKVTGAGTFQRLKLEGGDILRVEPNSWPVHTMMAESFYHLLLGNDYILWNSSIPLSRDPNHFDVSWYGGIESWKTKWQPTGGAIVNYDVNNPSHPKKSKGERGSIFPELSSQGETGAFIGAWLYSQISGVSDRVSRSLKYCQFAVNGQTFTPAAGAKGDGAMSSRISQNPGQDWIVTALEKQAPICICTEGKDGKAIIYQNPNAGLTGIQQLKVLGKSYTVTGNRINVLVP